MPKRNIFNPIAFLGFIGLLGLIGIFEGGWDWFIFFSWFVWFAWIKKPADERFFININKAARNGFIIAMMGISTILALLAMKFSYRIIIISVITLFEALLFGFIISFFFYEKRGF